MSKINTFMNDDYTGLEFSGYMCYFGYEETYCPKCKKANCDKDEHCDDQIWCFVVTKKGKEIFRYAVKEYEFECSDVCQGFYIGMGKFLKTLLK